MESVRKGETVIPTPRWFIGLRVAQIVVSLITLGLAGYFIHGAYYSSLGVAIAATIFTWIVALYAILTEHSAACRGGYNTWAVLSLDFFLVVLWLASLGANAAFRSAFTESVTADCYSDGSAINSGHCNILSKRQGYVSGPTGLAALSAVAGLSALLWLLFLATFSYVAHFFRLEWAKHSSDVEKAAGASSAPTAPTGNSEYVGQGGGQQQQQPQWAQQQQQQQYQQPGGYPQAPAYDPYVAPQNTGYAGAQGAYDQGVPQHAPQEYHGTPAPGQQPYYPPQH